MSLVFVQESIELTERRRQGVHLVFVALDLGLLACVSARIPTYVPAIFDSLAFGILSTAPLVLR